MKIDSEGYIERQTFAGKNARAKVTKRNWWLIKPHGKTSGVVGLRNVSFPENMVGKKVKFKLEIMEEK